MILVQLCGKSNQAMCNVEPGYICVSKVRIIITNLFFFRGRPVITVLEARPMNEVGFRDQSGGNRPKPEITVIGARPMSQGNLQTVFKNSKSY